MGNILPDYSQPARSSRKLAVIRNGRVILRPAAMIALIAALVSILFVVLWQESHTKKIELYLNGERQEIVTKAESVAALLDELAIDVKAYDDLSLDLDHKLQDGDRLALNQAQMVYVEADGISGHFYTTVDTVGETLEELNIRLGPEDELYPDKDASLDEVGAIKVVRVERVIEEVRETIPYESITKKDSQLLKGKEKVVQEGRPGTLVKKYEKVLEDGVVVSTRLIDERVEVPSQNRIVAVGTREPVTVLSSNSPAVETITREGITFGVKKVLKNVTLTAYEAGPQSTGKSKGDPGYGMTATGTRAQEGRTIAVDPKVIPLGWWVYIEGIGFRRAEDTGGAVKGNKIDLYYESLDAVKRFGKKSGYTVHIIGPKKPG